MKPYLLALVLTGWSASAAEPAAINRVLGWIDVDPGRIVGDVSTVNGGIDIGALATAAHAQTVNGHITLGSGAKAESLTTVNGDIKLDANSRVAGKVTAVNGALTLAHGANVGGELRNVNGSVSIDGAHVAGRLRTSTGTIEAKHGARLDGGILVDENQNNVGLFTWGTPKVVIGPGTVIGGPLKFERKVTLYISERAVVAGPIEGAVPTRYAGEEPPH